MVRLGTVRVVLWIVVLVVLLGTSSRAFSRGISNSFESAPSPPFLGNFINIWEDAEDNRNQEVIYNPELDEFLAIWLWDDGFTGDVWARRISSTGELRSWFNIHSVPSYRFIQADLAYSFLHRQYLVVMTYKLSDNDYDLYAVHFNDDGTGISSLIGIDADSRIQQNPAVAYNINQDEFLVVYENEKIDGSIETVARRIKGSDYSLLGGSRTIIGSVGSNQYRHSPAVAYNPVRNNYLVAYTFEDPAVPRAYISSRIVSSDLSTISTEVDLSSSFGLDAEIAVSNDQFLVAWWYPEYQVYARRVNNDGQPFGASGGFLLSSSTTGIIISGPPKVGYTHNFGYWIVWKRFDGQTYRESDIMGNTVLPNANQPSGVEFVIDNSPNYQTEPAIACRPNGSCLVTETCNLNNYPLGDNEIRGRLLTPQLIYIPQVTR
jgi:hypothetical protein